MTFTALHRLLGRPPGDLSEELLDDAVAAGLAETEDLDWKSELPPIRELKQSDFPKDVAAMANASGGILVYGVKETQKKATGRCAIREVDELYERALRSAAITAISPPVFGLGVHHLGQPPNHALVVEVPATTDGPHLIYRNDLFGAPIRNDADTVWMKERQVEAMYRARFDARRHATEALDHLYDEAAAGRETRARAWFIAVAHPRIPNTPTSRPSRDDARKVFKAAEDYALFYASRGGIHPLENVDRLNPRPGLRRWNAVNTVTNDAHRWKEAWAAIHHDGSVTLAAAIGGHHQHNQRRLGGHVHSISIECAVADFMGMIRAVQEHADTSEYEVRVGIEWTGDSPIIIHTVRNDRIYDGASIPLAHYTPVTTTVLADAENLDYYWQVHDLAEDCINQGGIPDVQLIRPPDRDV